MNTYNAYYNQQQAEVQATTSYDAQLKAIEIFKAPRHHKHMVHVVLAAKADVPVKVDPAQL